MGRLAPVRQDFTAVRHELDASAPFPVRGRASRGASRAVCADVVGLIDILCARFAVTRRMVGNGSFRAMARRYIASQPPSSPIPLHYGETFPRFLRSQDDSATMEYVADIAELEMLRGKSYCAPKTDPIAVQAFSSLSGRKAENLRLVLHPSVFLISSRFPVVTIWENNRCRDGNDVIRRWAAESALIARPFHAVDVWRLPPGGHAFIGALLSGRPIAAAVEDGITAASNFGIVANLRLLAEANIVIGCRGRARTQHASL
jgi:hypothetical protein